MLTNYGSFRESVSEVDAALSSLKVNIPQTPESLYNEAQVYKFTETPKLTEKPQNEPEEKKLMWPPPARLRPSTSMNNITGSLDEKPKTANSLSQSTFFLGTKENSQLTEAGKSKRKKWYKMFQPPQSRVTKESLTENQPEPREDSPDAPKRPWYKKLKKQKDKQKEKTAVLS
jgi:hypothetical protein